MENLFNLTNEEIIYLHKQLENTLLSAETKIRVFKQMGLMSDDDIQSYIFDSLRTIIKKLEPVATMISETDGELYHQVMEKGMFSPESLKI